MLAEYGMENVDWQHAVGESHPDTGMTSPGEKLAELMGRMCYGSFGPRQGRMGAKNYLGNVLAGGHGSVTEHAVWTFVVTRCSRGFTHQMVRHRAGVSPSQESQHFIRYTEADDEPGAQEAGLVLTGVHPDLHEYYRAQVENSLRHYAYVWSTLKANGLAKKEACERARGLLPSCLESRIGLTMNARAIRHFCELRGKADNALEIRLVACAMASIMMAEAPALFQDFTIEQGADGHPIVLSLHEKV